MYLILEKQGKGGSPPAFLRYSVEDNSGTFAEKSVGSSEIVPIGNGSVNPSRNGPANRAFPWGP